MRVREGIDGLKQLGREAPGSILSVGNFDGIHLGHRRLLDLAHHLRSASGGAIAIVTFEPHPLTVLRPEIAPPRLTPPRAKQGLLERAIVDQYVILPPSKEVLGLTAEQFWQIIRDEVRPRHMIEGRSFAFGKGRGGNIERLKQWAATSDVELHVLEPVEVALLDLQVVEVSSSLIRWLIANGRLRDAAICLGRAYSLNGQVVHGSGRGKKLGVPTANLKSDDQLIPADGVYAGRCAVSGATNSAANSIGTNPTFGDEVRQVEAHLIGFNGDLYGAELELEMVDWVREQRRFQSIETLVAQIKIDLARTLVLKDLDSAKAIAEVG
jgi:riboflavin kinase/FMN adenylyltransferase